MSIQDPAPGAGTPLRGAATRDDAATSAYRRGWWSLTLYPVSFLAAFAIGEGILSTLPENTGEPGSWQILLAAVPALIVFVIPGILSVSQGRKAMRLGRKEGRIPAIVGAAIAIGFVGLNVASYLVGLGVG